jgi:hypothetical protein
METPSASGHPPYSPEQDRRAGQFWQGVTDTVIDFGVNAVTGRGLWNLPSGISANYNGFRNAGYNKVDAAFMTDITMFSPVGKVGELIDGQSWQGADLGRPLGPYDYGSRGTSVTIDAAMVAVVVKIGSVTSAGGPRTTPGGRIITDHAWQQMTKPPPGRVPMTMAEVDQVIQNGVVRKIQDHPQGPTATIQVRDMPGKPQVVVDAATGRTIVTVIKNKP